MQHPHNMEDHMLTPFYNYLFKPSTCSKVHFYKSDDNSLRSYFEHHGKAVKHHQRPKQVKLKGEVKPKVKTSWWFQPNWKILVKIGSSSPNKAEKKNICETTSYKTFSSLTISWSHGRLTWVFRHSLWFFRPIFSRFCGASRKLRSIAAVECYIRRSLKCDRSATLLSF